MDRYFNKNNFLLLRFHFSIFLLPIFLFALSQCETIDWEKAGLAFFILHAIIYPSSNAYNSCMDKDETSIGGLKNPPKATKELLQITYIFDLIGIALSYFISIHFLLCVFVYVCISRFYSGWGLRLKQYPIWGYLVVIIFQGYFIFQAVYFSQSQSSVLQWDNWCAIAASLLLGAVYPLTQIYQHEEDGKRGDKTISMLLGIRGTFFFTVLMFGLASAVLFFALPNFKSFMVFNLGMLPGVIFFFYWFLKSYNNQVNANFENTMRMNVLSSFGLNISFLLLLLLKYL
jgi:1,4-dihydroxy-2-naphthoate polyprenyltransferase